MIRIQGDVLFCAADIGMGLKSGRLLSQVHLQRQGFSKARLVEYVTFKVSPAFLYNMKRPRPAMLPLFKCSDGSCMPEKYIWQISSKPTHLECSLSTLRQHQSLVAGPGASWFYAELFGFRLVASLYRCPSLSRD